MITKEEILAELEDCDEPERSSTKSRSALGSLS